MILSMGQLGLIFVMAVFLQDGRHLSAVDNGLWLLPIGVMIVLGSQIGGRLVQVLGATKVVRIGLTLEVLGLATVALVISPDVTFASLLPGFLLFGCGIGFAVAQLTNVILSDVPAERAGARPAGPTPPCARSATPSASPSWARCSRRSRSATPSTPSTAPPSSRPT